MTHLKITSLALLVSSTLLASACSNHQPKPDTAYTPSQEPDSSYHLADSTSPSSSTETLDTVAVTPLDPMIEPIDDTPIESLPDIPPELVVAVSEAQPKAEAEANPATLDADSRPAKTLFKFGFDQKTLDAEAEAQLRQHGQFLAAHPDLKININGHADPQGDTNYNKFLARQRADYVAKLLAEEGVATEQMQVESWGADSPAQAATHHRDNRRVELIYEEEYLVNYQGE